MISFANHEKPDGAFSAMLSKAKVVWVRMR